jgi:hypothetical protein
MTLPLCEGGSDEKIPFAHRIHQTRVVPKNPKREKVNLVKIIRMGVAGWKIGVMSEGFSKDGDDVARISP